VRLIPQPMHRSPCLNQEVNQALRFAQRGHCRNKERRIILPVDGKLFSLCVI